MHEDDVRAVLDRAVPDLPPSRVDPALAIRTARQRRRRTVTVAAAAAAVPVVVAAGAVAATRGEQAAPAAPAASRTAATTAPAPVAGPGLPTTPPRSFDPLLATLEVGWHPPAFAAVSRSTAPERQALAFTPRHVEVPDGEAAPPDTGLYVAVLAAGRSFGDAERSFGTDGAEEPVRTPTAPVRGRQAYCLSASCAALRWEYAPGTWAWVGYAGPGDPGAIARRVAESVSLGARERVRMPFRLTGATARLAVTGTRVETFPEGWTGSYGERWSASLDLDRPGSPRPGPEDHAPRGIRVDVLDRPAAAGGLPDGRDPAPNTEIGGLPANVSADGAELVRWGVRDTRLSVSVSSGPWRARSVDADLQLVTDPAGRSTWVDPVG
jgi:hypothetical protein